MERITESLQKFFAPLSGPQKAIFGLLAGVVLIFMILMVRWTFQTEYALLFGSLDLESANEIVEDLESRGVPYRVEDSGRSIFVSSDRVHEMRMQLASKGLANPGVQGYELFDANTLGMTDFMQQVNKKRALEGELARSINSLQQVEFSRIHLVMPERTPFQQTTVRASASVILSLKRGQPLSKPQIDGITSLIAGSVEGLDASGVTVLDQAGNRLTDDLSADGQFGNESSQIQLRQRTEAYLTERGQSMLDWVLGPGNSILRVAAEHDFDRIMRESDLIDPDTRTIISEERRNQRTNNQGFQQVPIDDFTPVDRRGQTVMTSTSDNENVIQTRNYEMNKTREVFEKPPGEIKRISASVLLNYKRGPATEDGPSFTPYTQQEVQELQEIVRNALGIQFDRGDEVTMTQIQFYDPVADEQFRQYLSPPTPWYEILRYVLMFVALLIVVGLIYSITRKIGDSSLEVLFRQPGKEVEQDQLHIKEKASQTDVSEQDIYKQKLSESAQIQLSEKYHVIAEIKEFVNTNSDEAINVVRTMIASS